MNMKAVVFDNSGTLISRYRAIKDLNSGFIYDHISSIDLVDKNPHRALVVLQTDPSTCLVNAKPDQTIHQFIERNKVPFDISYSSSDIKKEDVLTLIKNENAKISDIQDTIQTVVENDYNVQICSGSGFIMNTSTGHIEFTITAGGKIFPEVPEVVEELKKRSFHIYVASGDRMKSLEELANFIHIPSENVFGTADSWRKKEIVAGLRSLYKVMMVGNSANDILALKEADLGVLTTQQTEETAKKVFDAADVVVSNIKEILDIDF